MIARLRRFAERLRKTLPGRVVARYREANAGPYAAAIAYTALFALIPIALALITIIGLFLRNQVAFQQLTESLSQVLPPGTAGEIVTVLRAAREQTGLLGIASFLGLLWAGSALFGVIAESFNHSYAVPNRPFLRQRVMALLMILLFAVLLLLSFSATALAQFLIEFAAALRVGNLPGFLLLAPAVSYLISIASALALFLSIYYVVPNLRLTVAEAWPGAILAALLFVLLLQVFPLYVRYFAGFGRYGALGLAILLLTWFYFIAQLLLLGAALNAELRTQRSPFDDQA